MFFLDPTTVYECWSKCINKTSSKFWGFLSLLKEVRRSGITVIQSDTTYRINTAFVKRDLQLRFHFGSDIRNFADSDASNNISFLRLSTKWIEQVPSVFFNSQKLPSLFEVAVVALYDSAFDRVLQRQELIERFFLEYNLTNDIVEEWFIPSIDIIPISYIERDSINEWATITKQRLYDLLKDHFNIPDGKYNLAFEANCFIKAHPTENNRSSFIQPLYAGQGIQKCLLLTTFNLSEYYPTIESFGSEDQTQGIQIASIENFNRNRIVYGAPGTGKSNMILEDAKAFGERQLRITFYTDYNYSKFLGSYKPTSYYKEANSIFYNSRTGTSIAHEILNEPVIDYGFRPGPFLKALVSAYLNDAPYLLIIEEINRGNAAAVFAEVFQLLDREEGISKYPVMLSEEAMTYLNEELGEVKSKVEKGVFLPKNLYIWATMNSADQGVFPLDSAFKRRWSFEYISLNKFENAVQDLEIRFDGTIYNWNAFRHEINNYLSNLRIPEDRLIGPFFLDKEELLSQSAIKNKLLLYLRSDVLRHNPDKFFNGNKNFYQLFELYGRGEILNMELAQLLKEIAKEDNDVPLIIDEDLSDQQS
jgi:hypothetical protein